MKPTLRVAAGVVLLFATQAIAQANPRLNSTVITKILAKTPSCAMSCFADGFKNGNCTVAGLTDCVCTNIPLQAQVSACVQQSCKFELQVVTARVSQELCQGYPYPERRRTSRIFSVVLPTIATAIVALRCVARLQVTNQLWWDDWTALISLFFLLLSSGLGFANAQLGFGLHYWDIEPGSGKTILQIFYVMQMFYIFILSVPSRIPLRILHRSSPSASVSAKASICCFYTRVFTTNNKRFRLATRSFMLFLLSHGLMFTFLVAFQCLPVPAIWDRSIEGRCLSINAIGFTGSACNILEDVILFIMPIPELMKLQLSMRKKLALVFMFSVASFACIASMIRLKYMVSYANTYDATWDNVDVVIWSSIEINLTVMCGSLPALRPLFKKIPGFISTVKETAQSGYRHGRRSQNPSGAVKSEASRHSIALSSEPSPRKPMGPRPFSSSTASKDVYITRDSRIDSASHDDLERLRDWAPDKSSS